MRRALNSMCLSVCVICLVSLAGWQVQVQDRRHLKTAVETIQVSLPELLSRSSLAVSVSAFDTPSYIMRQSTFTVMLLNDLPCS